MITDFWSKQLSIAPNNFKFKSLSNWSCNIAVGCEHACRFCYVPEASTNKLGKKLAMHGVKDPDAEWGEYVFLRQWDGPHFMNTLKAAERTKAADLAKDGNRAVMFCTTTDPYMVIRNADPVKQQALATHRSYLMVEALRHIRDLSTLNVRILTRGPLARKDFELMKSFGNRLLFGMSLPTLNNRLAKVYEPKAPAPSQRLDTLRAAKAAGLNVYVAVAPVYPECDEADMKATLAAIKELDPVTVFMEPINIRAENIARIKKQADAAGVRLKTDVFSNSHSWRAYALNQLLTFEELADEAGLYDRLHLWPDASLGSAESLRQFPHSLPDGEGGISLHDWLQNQWSKVSAWPK